VFSCQSEFEAIGNQQYNMCQFAYSLYDILYCSGINHRGSTQLGTDFIALLGMYLV